jgi:hypothetical protein
MYRYKKKEYREKNKEDILKKAKEYYRKNKEKHKKYRRENKEKIAARMVEWRKNNRDKIKKTSKKYKKNNKDRIRKTKKIWIKNNKDRINKKTKEWVAKRKKEDSVFAFKLRIRKTIGESIKKGGYIKKDSTQNIVGCSFLELKDHLEKTFKNNYGISVTEAKEVLHIDHVIPLSTAKTEEEVIKLNHYSNLQYLYASDNLKKGAKLDWKLPENL